jgi:uncharacterized protein (TIGR00251 family)
MVHVKETAGGLVVPLVVAPRAGRDCIRGEHGGRLKVSVTAPPEKGKANEALCRFLAAELGVSRSQVRVLAGHSSRLKEVLIERVSRGALDAIIAGAAAGGRAG